MGLFNKKESYLGIDIGTSSIKVSEFRNEEGRPRLLSYGFVEQPSEVLKSDSPEAIQQVVTTLLGVFKKGHMQSRKVVSALPSYAVFTSILSLPVMPKKDLYSAIRWEAKKIVPMSLDEMVLDWRLLHDPEEATDEKGKKSKKDQISSGGPKNTRVLITAAPKNLVKRYIDIFKLAELEIVSLETESFALVRSLLGRDNSTVMVVDIGAIATEISVILDGIPFLNRSIDVGGETITKSIANSLNIDAERAEQIKRDFGVMSGPSTSQIPRVIEFVMQNIVNEIRYILSMYQNQGEKPIEKIVLSGGSAFLPNLPSYLEQMIKLKCYIGDPWARVVYPVELKPVLDEIGPRFAVANGLAMREIV
ncbi:MAG: type IV pilus assembly protein PilM [Candidatus Nomurabacteria bacterium]|nr:MAG: type IV pilus assembly protein PilM [Candidatus Nomurabacteria bacterium]